MTARHAIDRARRDLILVIVVKALLIGSALVIFFAGPLLRLPINDSTAFVVLMGIWVFLSYRSVRGISRFVASSPALIAAGQFDEAERRIEQSINGFSIFRAGKLLSLHHLAVLRHAQRQYSDAVDLARALLSHRLGSLSRLSRHTRLILADASLEIGDLRTCADALGMLHRQRLSLGEAVTLMQVELDYQSRISAWPNMLDGLTYKVQLAELLPSAQAARCHAMLGLAALNEKRMDLAMYLRDRAALLGDVVALAVERPQLNDLFAAERLVSEGNTEV